MFEQYLFEAVSAAYENKILLYDDEQLLQFDDYLAVFKEHGFQIVFYEDDLEFRKKCGKIMRDLHQKLLVIAESAQYVPYDIQKCCFVKQIAVSNLFDGMAKHCLEEFEDANLDLLALAYKSNVTNPVGKSSVRNFLERVVLSEENLLQYIKNKLGGMRRVIENGDRYKDWFEIAGSKAEIDRLSVRYRLEVDTSWINEAFSDWLLLNFGKLSGESDKESPVLVSRAMEFMRDNSKKVDGTSKFVIVVMDGMSEFDWSILKKSFSDIKYTKTYAFAMIPTVTAISRQCLLAGKYPSQLESPWNQQKEESEFKKCATGLGFKENQICYCRGYNNDFKPSIKCAAVIINEIDDMVHGQLQERLGMYNGIEVMAQSGKLAEIVKKYIKQGFDVYITADHGNTPCVGMGVYRGAGVETTTKSRRMMVVNDLADKEALMAKYPLVEFPQYYLDKKYTYLICDGQASYDCKGETVMSHGGITIDEVVVPFIKVMARDNNG